MIQKKVNIVYEIILELLKRESHGRELSKKLDTSLTRVKSALKELYDLNVIYYTVSGKNHTYNIRNNLVAKTYVMNAENYKLSKTIMKNPILEPIFKEILKITKSRLIMLFGSYAKGQEKKNRDIDIYIENLSNNEISLIKNINGKISVKTVKFNDKDLLIREIINNHVIIRGVEDYYEKIGFLEKTER